MGPLEVEMRLRELGLRYTRHGSRIRAQCPCHNDRNPSLLISWTGNRIMVKCFAGCQSKDILNVLGYGAERPEVLPDFKRNTSVDVVKGIDLLTAAWQNIDIQDQPLSYQELLRRRIPWNRYKVVDAERLVETIKRTATRTDLLESGLAYERDGRLVFRHVFDANRVVIPYLRGERVVSIRSRKAGVNDKTPKYLSLKGYPARAYVARAVPGTVLVVVEGEFKSMVLAEHLPEDVSVIGLPGVTAAWDDLQELCRRYMFWRKFVLFDAEAENEQVWKAAYNVARRIDADVLEIELLDGERRMAPDDFVLQYGIEPILQKLTG